MVLICYLLRRLWKLKNIFGRGFFNEGKLSGKNVKNLFWLNSEKYYVIIKEKLKNIAKFIYYIYKVI